MSILRRPRRFPGMAPAAGGLVPFFFLVWGWVPTAAQNDKECLDCHPGYYENLAGAVNHSPFDQRDCYACHRFHGFRNATELTGTITEICGQCHDIIDATGEDYLHGPVAEESSCLNCHDPHSADARGLLKTSAKRICIECHDSPDDASGTVHPPYRDSSCTECHNPHGSPFGAFLVMPAEYVCQGCHADQMEGLEMSRMHAAGEEQICERCHTGHQSPYGALLHAAPDELCLNCHTVLASALTSTPRHSALYDGSCLTCHKAHFEVSGSHLVESQRELCFSCHEAIKGLVDGKGAHAPSAEDCTGCHDPHLRSGASVQLELCGGCHDLESQPFVESHANLIPATCSECHNPHGAVHPKLIRTVVHVPFAEKECMTCHDREESDGRLTNNDLCRGCHTAQGAKGGHERVEISGKSCVACHSPHTSDNRGLLRRGS